MVWLPLLWQILLNLNLLKTELQEVRLERVVAIIPHRKTSFGQAVFSYKASHQ